jgi:hypothetical protein
MGKRGKREGDKIERGERGEGEMVEKRRGGGRIERGEERRETERRGDRNVLRGR